MLRGKKRRLENHRRLLHRTLLPKTEAPSQRANTATARPVHGRKLPLARVAPPLARWLLVGRSLVCRSFLSGSFLTTSLLRGSRSLRCEIDRLSVAPSARKRSAAAADPYVSFVPHSTSGQARNAPAGVGVWRHSCACGS